MRSPSARQPWRISAWAEEPRLACRRSGAPGAHLRVGGGADVLGWFPLFSRGASPRGRRSLCGFPMGPDVCGRISAWAEEPVGNCAGERFRKAHLRVGGGAMVAPTDSSPPHGASPRGRRGLGMYVPEAIATGRISAWAEEPRSRRSSATASAAHLRVGGGADIRDAIAAWGTGASPRGRRSRSESEDRLPGRGRISAWAEEPRRRARPGRRSRAHLRVGGGAKRVRCHATHDAGASPRGRRSPERRSQDKCVPRRISAWAEEPGKGKRCENVAMAHLRVGGGAPPLPHRGKKRAGASPRGRRSRASRRRSRARRRRISAWAEEPGDLPRGLHRRPAHLRVGGGASGRRSLRPT